MKKILIALFIILLFFLTYKKFNTKKDFEKVLYIETPCSPVTLDPSISDGEYEAREISKVYEPLLAYHYLKRPYEIIPELAEEIPTVSEDGLIYTFKIKKNVFFHDNKCFKDGKGRELEANDFVFSIKRVADPKLQSSLFAFFDEKIVGLNEWREKNVNNEKTDYTEEVEGIKAIDKYTLQIKLKKKCPQFLMIMCMPHTVAIPKEAVDFYVNKFGYNPVGTGPFTIGEYKPQENKIIAIKNKNYRDKFYPTEACEELAKKGFLKYAGKKVPFVDKIVTSVILEDQPRWLKFKNKDLDIVDLRGMSNLKDKIQGNKISEELLKKGVLYSMEPRLATSMIFFNVTSEPFKNNKYLRQAISMSIDRERANSLIYDGVRIVAKGIIPPGADGYYENFINENSTRNIEKAKELLMKAGYSGGEGLPEIEFLVNNNLTSLRFAELVKSNLEEIGVKLVVKPVSWAEMRNLTSSGKYQMTTSGWLLDYPDSENILSLFFNGKYLEYSGYNDEKFNDIYKSASEIISSDRIVLYKQLNEILCEEVPAAPLFHEAAMHMHYSWVKNFVYFDPTHLTYFQYIDIDIENRDLLKKR